MGYIQHIRTAAYHPSSNGLAERYVQTIKEGLKKTTDGTIKSRVASPLSYRITPQSTTGVSPAELMFRKKLRIRLTNPGKPSKAAWPNRSRIMTFTQSSKTSKKVYMLVYVFNNLKTPKWLPGIIQRKTGPVSFCC